MLRDWGCGLIYDEDEDEFVTNEEYKEIFRLEQMLLSNNIPYRLRKNFDGWQIGYPDLPPDKSCRCSVIQHYGSYGGKEDLLEIMGLVKDTSDSVEGWLSAEDVFERIYSHFNSCVLKQ